MKVFQGRLVHCRNPVVNEEGKRDFRIEILERTAIGINDEGTVKYFSSGLPMPCISQFYTDCLH